LFFFVFASAKAEG